MFQLEATPATVNLKMAHIPEVFLMITKLVQLTALRGPAQAACSQEYIHVFNSNLSPGAGLVNLAQMFNGPASGFHQLRVCHQPAIFLCEDTAETRWEPVKFFQKRHCSATLTVAIISPQVAQ